MVTFKALDEAHEASATDDPRAFNEFVISSLWWEMLLSCASQKDLDRKLTELAQHSHSSERKRDYWRFETSAFQHVASYS